MPRNFVEDVPDAPEQHGTAVAGISNARSGKGIGMAGIAPGAKIMALRAGWERGGGAAHVAGLAALLAQVQPRASGPALWRARKASAARPRTVTGTGQLTATIDA